MWMHYSVNNTYLIVLLFGLSSALSQGHKEEHLCRQYSCGISSKHHAGDWVLYKGRNTEETQIRSVLRKSCERAAKPGRAITPWVMRSEVPGLSWCPPAPRPREKLRNFTLLLWSSVQLLLLIWLRKTGRNSKNPSLSALARPHGYLPFPAVFSFCFGLVLAQRSLCFSPPHWGWVLRRGWAKEWCKWREILGQFQTENEVRTKVDKKHWIKLCICH